MGFLHKLNLGRKKIDDEKREDFENRVKQFLEEYETVKLRYRIEFMTILQIEEQGIRPVLKLSDISEKLNKKKN